MSKIPGTNISLPCNSRSNSSNINTKHHHYHHQPSSQILLANTNSNTTNTTLQQMYMYHPTSNTINTQHHYQHSNNSTIQHLHKHQDSPLSTYITTPWHQQVTNITINPQWGEVPDPRSTSPGTNPGANTQKSIPGGEGHLGTDTGKNLEIEIVKDTQAKKVTTENLKNT